MPATRIAQPTTSARFGAIRPANNWVTADATNTADATAPATAWLTTPMTSDRNAGATEANSPVTAKPANAAMAAIVNTPRTSGGTASRCSPMRSCALGGFRHHQNRDRGQQNQPDVHDECQMEGLGCVLDQQAGQQRAAAKTADVGGSCHRGGAVVPIRRCRFDDRGGGGAGEDARRQPGQARGPRAAAAQNRRPGTPPRWRARTRCLPTAPAAARWRPTTGRRPEARTAPRTRRWRR